jgi:hypothetical protein
MDAVSRRRCQYPVFRTYTPGAPTQGPASTGSHAPLARPKTHIDRSTLVHVRFPRTSRRGLLVPHMLSNALAAVVASCDRWFHCNMCNTRSTFVTSRWSETLATYIQNNWNTCNIHMKTHAKHLKTLGSHCKCMQHPDLVLQHRDKTFATYV